MIRRPPRSTRTDTLLPAVGLGVVMAGKEEDDIQVRRGRQRAATQPPQPQYDKPAAIDLAVDRFELRRRRLREREDRGFGEAAVPGGDIQRVEQSLDDVDAPRKAPFGHPAADRSDERR